MKLHTVVISNICSICAIALPFTINPSIAQVDIDSDSVKAWADDFFNESLAEKRLSADTINFSTSTSSVKKGESLRDTVQNIEAMKLDMVVVRHKSTGVPYYLTQCMDANIVNAGYGAHEHPTQALLDMFTIQEVRGSLENLKVLIVGDIAHSRVARSNIFGLRKFSSQITVCGPSTLIPYEFEKMEVRVSNDLDEEIASADIIMMLRIQKERQGVSFFPSLREYVDRFALTPQRLKKAKKNCLVMHPGPVNWDIEISSSLKERVHPLILKQAENGLAVRMAVLYLVGTKKREI